MFKGHPWEGEEFGPLEYEWYLTKVYNFNVEFEVDMKPFIRFCKATQSPSQQLMLKIASRLSAEFLPQRTVALNRRSYPARYPAGYVRPVRPGADMLEHVGVREKPDSFAERPVRDNWRPLAKYLARNYPRFSVWLGRYFFAHQEVKNNYALMVTRNPLRNLGAQVTFHGSNYRTYIMAIPFGERVTCVFGAPHALGNMNYYEGFLKKFIAWVETPETLPRELVEKPYRDVVRGRDY